MSVFMDSIWLMSRAILASKRALPSYSFASACPFGMKLQLKKVNSANAQFTFYGVVDSFLFAR